MFDHIRTEAYTRLREEITSAIVADLDNGFAEVPDFNAGRMYAYSKILAIVSKVNRDMIDDLDREAEKEAAYYSHEKQ